MGNRFSRRGVAAGGDNDPPAGGGGDGNNGEDESSVRESSLRSTGSQGSYYSMIRNSYQQLVNAIIRPPRCRYTIDQLGPTEFDYCGRRIRRKDFQLTNPRNLNFECSLWEPVASDRPSERLPCVIYMHGNSSARIEALSSLSVILTLGATLLAIDFAGSGLSEGEYVSLGAFEKEDLAVAVEYLRNAQTTSTIALWGRSMGAATALLHGERDPSIAGMVLDSAFADLTILAEDMVEKGRQHGLFAPNFVVKIAIKFVRSSVQKAANFDIKTLSPIEHADKCFIPAMFIAGEGDQFVLPRHSQSIYDKYGGDKNLVLVEGDHNSPRPRYLYDSISIFLQQTLQIPQEWISPDGEMYVRRLPWTYRPHPAYNNNKAGKARQDLIMSEEDENEALALALMQEEMEMQSGVQESLYSLLSGGGHVSSSTENANASNSGSSYNIGGTVASPPPAASASNQQQKKMDRIFESSHSERSLNLSLTEANLHSNSKLPALSYHSNNEHQLRVNTTDHASMDLPRHPKAALTPQAFAESSYHNIFDGIQPAQSMEKGQSIAAKASVYLDREEDSRQKMTTAGEDTVADGMWKCPRCTLYNELAHLVCDACTLPRPRASTEPVKLKDGNGKEGSTVASTTAPISAKTALNDDDE